MPQRHFLLRKKTQGSWALTVRGRAVTGTVSDPEPVAVPVAWNGCVQVRPHVGWRVPPIDLRVWICLPSTSHVARHISTKGGKAHVRESRPVLGTH